LNPVAVHAHPRVPEELRQEEQEELSDFAKPARIQSENLRMHNFLS